METIAGKHYQTDSMQISSTGRAGIRHIEIEKRYNNEKQWNKSYTIYVGANLDHIKRLGGDPDVDLYLLYPIQYFTGKLYSNVVILYRHLMPKLDFEHAILNVSDSHADPHVCHLYMNDYYPLIEFVKE